MIIKYLTELLLDHECVIVPEFGAFITKETPASLDYVTNMLTPPSKELVFNGQLVGDDGLLIGYIAEHEGYTMTDAAKMVHDFAMTNLAVLEASGVLRLDGMGVLTRMTERDYVFQLDEGLNLLGDAFGLTTIKTHPVYRQETYHHIATEIAAEQKEKNTEMSVIDEVETTHHVTSHNYKWFRAAAYSLMIATVLVFLGWGAGKKDSNFASWNPFFYASPNEFIANHFSGKMEAREFASVETMPFINVELPIFKKEINYLQPRDFKPVRFVDETYYYIIGASLRNENDAEKCVKSFQKKGFEGAVALPMNDQGNIRVAYDVVMGKEAAQKRLEIIKEEFNKDAWMLRKK